jgi:hypothetical protein
VKHVKIGRLIWAMSKVRRAIRRDPQARDYRDVALTPVTDGEFDALEMFNVSAAARTAVAKVKAKKATAAANVV